MIAKGASRSGPRQLAVYLMRVERWDTGEPAELLELRSPWAAGVDGADRHHTADQLIEAFRDWQTLVEGTKQGRDGLYHAEINPEAHYARNMTPEQWIRSADILAEELGLQDQPRALVLHAGKDDRPHLHVVWQRTDVDTMKVITDGYNYIAHERASQRMELEFGHEFVPGKHAKRDRTKQPEFPREKLSRDEAQYEERTGLSKEKRIEQITALHATSDNGLAFKNALGEAGYILAKGDRGYMVVDQAGGHSVLSRNIKGLKQKDVNAFMAGIDLAALPTIEEAQALQEEAARMSADQPVKAEKPTPEASQFLAPQPPVAEAQPAQEPPDVELEALKKALTVRQAVEVKKWAIFHAHELRQLEFEIDHENELKLGQRDTTDLKQMDALKARLTEERRGLKGLLAAIEARWNPQLAAEKKQVRQKEIRDLKRRQEQERKDYAALIEQTKQLEIENLQERQRQKMVDIALEHGQEEGRYIREREEQKRILSDLIEQQRREIEEELKHNDSLRDGPPPPKLGK